MACAPSPLKEGHKVGCRIFHLVSRFAHLSEFGEELFSVGAASIVIDGKNDGSHPSYAIIVC